MSLQFISVQNGNSSSRGSKERRLIRSHVMRGRNTGKSRPSPQQLGPPKRFLVRYDCLGCSEALTARRVHTCACYGQMLDMRQLIWNDLAMVSVPYQLDKRLRGLIHQCKVRPTLVVTVYLLIVEPQVSWLQQRHCTRPSSALRVTPCCRPGSSMYFKMKLVCEYSQIQKITAAFVMFLN